MKKIFILLTALFVVSVSQVAEAQGILFGVQRDTTKINRKKGGLIQVDRIDRAIDKNVFAYKGEWICGVTASYGTITSDDSDLALVLENLNLGGSIISVKPYFGYFYRDNLSVGARFGYTHTVGYFDGANINMGNFIEGMACVGGCIGGAGCRTHGEKNKAEVDKYGKEAMEKTIKDAVSILNLNK